MDIHEQYPKHPIYIDRVGIVNIIKDLKIEYRSKQIENIRANIDIYTSLQHNKKGIHMSRLQQSINEFIIDKNGKYDSIESFIVSLMRFISEKVRGSISVELRTSISYKTYSNKFLVQDYIDCIFYAFLYRNGVYEIIENVKATGITTCPCAQRTISEQLENNDIMISHSQRAIAEVCFVNTFANIDIFDVYELLCMQFSAGINDILKRDNEAEVIIQAHKNPKFVEDVVRSIYVEFVNKYDKSSFLYAKVRSIESIHKYDAVAQIANYHKCKRYLHVMM